MNLIIFNWNKVTYPYLLKSKNDIMANTCSFTFGTTSL